MSNVPTDADFDFLCLEELIVSRLQATVPELARIESDSTLDSVKGRQLPTPSALVLYIGHQVLQSNPEEALIEQTWTVVLVVRHANDKSGAAGRNVAGPLFTQVKRALHGWQPNEYIAPLVWADAGEAEQVDGGVLYLPMAFKTSFSM